MAVGRFLDQAKKGDSVTVQGLVKWIANMPTKQYKGHFYRNIIITDMEDHTAPELKITLIDGACKMIEGRAGDLVTFSGEVSAYNDKPKKLAKAKLISDVDDAMETEKNNRKNNANDEDKARRSIAPVVGMLYNNFFEAKAKAFDYDPNGTTIESVHNETIKEITRQRIQDVLDLTDKFLHPKSEAEEVFDDPFEGE